MVNMVHFLTLKSICHVLAQLWRMLISATRVSWSHTWVMDVAIKDAVVRKQSHGRAYSISDVVDVQQEEHQSQNCALWDTGEDLSCV